MNPQSVSIEELLAHEGWLRRVVVDLVDDDEVDDVLQETWIAALAARRILHPRAWLKRVAHNLALGRRRGTSRRRKREAEAARPEALPSTAEIVERVHAHRELANAVTALAEPYRTAVLLRYFEQLPPREIAERLGVPSSTVRTRIERGLDQVRDRLERRDVRGLVALILLPRTGERPVHSASLLGRGNDILAGVLAVSFRNKLVSALSLVLVVVSASIWGFSADAEKSESDTDPIAAIAEQDASPDVSESPEVETPPRTVAAVEDVPKLHGIARDTFGAPIANVALEFVRTGTPVYSSSFDGLEPATDGERIDLGITDANGGFASACDAETGQLHATGEFVTVRFHVPPRARWTDEEATVVVARRAGVRGKVVDEKGHAIAGAVVVPKLIGLVHYTEPLEHMTQLGMVPRWADAAGVFEIEGLPALDELDLVVSADGYESARVRAAFDRDLEVELTEREEPTTYRVSGIVVDERGAPVTGASVLLGTSVTASGREGRFEVRTDSIDARTRFGAGLPGFQPVERPAVVGALLAEVELDDVTLRLGGPALSIYGKVVDERSEPLDGAVLCILGSDELDVWTTVEDFTAGREGHVQSMGTVPVKVDARSDADGRFTLAGLGARTYRVRAFDPDSLASRTIVLEPTASPVTIELDGATERAVRGVVRLKSGLPVVGASVRWRLTTYESATKRLVAPGDAVETDDEGRFELAGIPSGDAHLGISAREILDHEVDLTGVMDGAELEIVPPARCRMRVLVDSPAATRVRVLSADGQELGLRRTLGQISYSSDSGWDLEHGRTPVLEVSEEAAWLIVMADEKSLAQYPIVLSSEGVAELRF